MDGPLTLVFYNKKTGRKLEAIVGIPTEELTEHGRDWRCEFCVITDASTVTKHAWGTTWLQAILIAFKAATVAIAKEEDEWETADGEPAWQAIPMLVPTSWKFDFFDKCRRYIREQESLLMEEIEARRKKNEEGER